MNLRRAQHGTLLGLLLCFSATAQDLKMVATDWAPYVDTSITRNGVAVSLVTEALQRAGYRVQLYLDDWPRALISTQAGEFDLIATLWRTDERAESIAFSEPFMQNELRFLRRVGDEVRANEREDLVGRRIGVVVDYAYGEQPYDTTGIEIVRNGSVGESIESLLAGDVDLVLGDSLVLRHEVDKRRMAKRVELLPSVLESRGLRIGVSKQRADHAEIIAAFDDAIAAMREDGSYNSMLGMYRISN